MPYFSSSRVGAVPQGQPSKQKKRSERFGRRKGITMEDLKKQTAIRLAQEQHGMQDQSLEYVASDGQPSNEFVANPAPAITYSSPSVVPGRPTKGVASAPTGENHPRPYASPVPPVTSGTYRSPTVPLSNISTVPSIDVNRQAPAPYYDHGRVEVAHGKPGPTGYPLKAKDSTGYPHHGIAAGKKAKLPHGLTVQELKEMTKARLQAEAADKVDDTAHIDHNNRSRANSHASPVPPGFYHQGSREAWSQDSRAEAWETASVSTSASDAYLNSELPDEFRSNTPFNRSRSYPTAGSSPMEVPAHIGTTSPAPPSASYYDNYVPNRRRAATLSPRLGLSYVVHEDRAAASSELIAPPPVLTSHQPRSSAFTPRHYHYGQGAVISQGDTTGNRQRTSSTTSLPSISHTASEFELDHQGAASRFASHFGTVREDSPVTQGLGDVFRDHSFPSSPIPTGLLGSGESLGLSGPSSSNGGLYGGDNRMRASTWSDPTSGNLFGSGLIGGQEVQLSDDFASILKLSGPSEDGKPKHGGLFSSLSGL